jgi:hypothetical protein
MERIRCLPATIRMSSAMAAATTSPVARSALWSARLRSEEGIVAGSRWWRQSAALPPATRVFTQARAGAMAPQGGAGDEARTRDPYLGKVRLQIRIREGQKMALRRLLRRWIDAVRRGVVGRSTSSHSDLSVIEFESLV